MGLQGGCRTQEKKTRLDELGEEVVSQRIADRGLGFELVERQSIGNHLNQGCAIAGHQNLIRPQVQGQLRFLQTRISLNAQLESSRILQTAGIQLEG